jgi:hypothetical protein
MPIHRLLSGAGFDPEHCQAMATAFEGALRDLNLTDRNDPLCDLIAKTIIAFGQQGIREPARLHALTMKAITE